jgi:hypothetical protein
MVVSFRALFSPFNRLVAAAGRPNILALWFVLCALLTGLGLIWNTPMGEAPDEPGHALRADGLLHGQIVGRVQPGLQIAGIRGDIGALRASQDELMPSFPARPLPPAARRQAQAEVWGGTGAWPTNMIDYFPALYVPGAIGIGLGRVFGAGPLLALYLGRLGMLASYVTMGFVALRLAAFGQPLLFALLTLPMGLGLAASLNQDGQLIGAAVLAAALLTRRERAAAPLMSRGRDADWGLALFCLVLCAKPPYAPLLLAWLLPLRAAGIGRRGLKVVLATLPPVLWMIVMLHYSFAPWPRPPYHPGPLWPGSPGIWLSSTSTVENLRCLLAHPAQIWLLPVHTLISSWPVLAPSLLGVFGWGPVMMRPWQYAGWGAALAAGVAGVLAEPRAGWRATEAGFVLLLLLATFLTMSLSLYLTWTNVGDNFIAGINGRYYLLLPPFLLLVLPGLGQYLPPGRGVLLARLCCLPALVMAVLDIPALPALLRHAFGPGGL